MGRRGFGSRRPAFGCLRSGSAKAKPQRLGISRQSDPRGDHGQRASGDRTDLAENWCRTSYMDRVDPKTRSRMMASIRGRNTRPELLVRRSLHAAGLRFRLHVKGLPGRPDIVLPGRRLVVFVHGCFWHRHPGCRFATTPATRQDFWASKFAANVARDHMNAKECQDAGWSVRTVWECETRQPERLAAIVSETLAHPLATNGRSHGRS